MLYLKHDHELLVISGDKDTLGEPAINSFLSGLGFAYGESVYQYNGTVSEDMVYRIVDFFGDYGEDLEMDQVCREYYEKRVARIQNFDVLRKEGLRIKSILNPEPINIPLMSKERDLMPYQIMPVKHALALGNVANFSVPGSGKTWMAYSTYLLMKYGCDTFDNKVEKMLVIGPLSSFRPWESEYREITGHEASSVRIRGNESQREKIFNDSDSYEIFLTSYPTAEKEADQIITMLQRWPFMVVVDESHHIKNPTGKQAIAIRKISKFAAKRMILTGTPVPNTLMDLWSQFTFLYPDNNVLGTFEKFNYDLESQDARTLNERLNPYFTRVSKSMLNLPAQKINRIPIPMSKIQRRIYATIAHHINTNDANYYSDMAAMKRWRKNTIMYLLEASTDPSLLMKNTQFNENLISSEGLPIQDLLNRYHELEVPNKIQAVRSLVEDDLKRRNKVVIWCSFIATIQKLANILKSYKPLTVYGMIPRDDEQDDEDNRERRIETFMASPTHNVLIANPASLAESISLHRVCHHAIYVDRTFNGGHYLQSLERIHRIGMDPNVEPKYTIFMSKDTIDYDINNRLEIKKKRLQRFLDDDALRTLDMDYDYNDPIGSEDDLDEDYRTVLARLQRVWS